MLTKDEENYLAKISEDKIINIYPFDNQIIKTVDEIIDSIKKTYPDLKIKHMGASALKISGQAGSDTNCPTGSTKQNERSWKSEVSSGLITS